MRYLNNFIGIYGSDAVAAYGIAYKIDMVPIMLSVGLSQGAAPLVGYYYGAGKKEQMLQVMRTATLYGVLMGGVFLGAFWLLGAAAKSLLITLMRNAILFIPAVVLLNHLWQLNGVIAAQPAVETLLAALCIGMYAMDCGKAKREA